MESLQLLFSGFAVALSVENIGAALLGAVLGLIVGAMPGIGSLAGCALLLPITFGFNPTTAIIMLGAIYISTCTAEPSAPFLSTSPATRRPL